MKIIKWFINGLLVIGCVVAILYYVVVHKINTDPTTARKAGAPIPVMLASAKSVELNKVIGANGVVQPIDIIDIKTKFNTSVLGDVEEVFVDLGDIVTAKQKLIRFAPERARLALASAKAKLIEAEAELASLNNDLVAVQAMYKQKMIARVKLDDLNLRLVSAKTTFQLAIEKHYLAQKDFENTTLVAPANAIVMERNVSLGEMPQKNEVLLTLGQIDHVLVEAQFSESNLQDIYLGQKASVNTLAFQTQMYEGTVVKIKPVTDPKTKTFYVYVKLANPNMTLKPGLTSFVRLQSQKQSLAVPSVSLLKPTASGQNALFVEDEDQQVQLREVSTGTSASQLTEIRSGLKDGDKIVVVGQYYLKDGDKVRNGN